MGDKDEFYIGYADSVGEKTKKSIRVFVFAALGSLILGALLFGFFQRPASNSSFDFDTATKVSGVYHEMPYPMLRVTLEKGVHKNILLLGFGKFGANPYLKDIRKKEGTLEGKQLTIDGNLIYYNEKPFCKLTIAKK